MYSEIGDQEIHGSHDEITCYLFNFGAAKGKVENAAKESVWYQKGPKSNHRALEEAEQGMENNIVGTLFCGRVIVENGI